eukprot:6256163-Lingulodinium_polyedra.AAC.1
MAIRQLAPRWQEPPKSEAKSFRVRQPRKWPRLRKTITDERHCCLNIHKQIADSKRDPFRSTQAYDSFPEFVDACKEKYGTKEKNIMKCLYLHAFKWILTLYLAMPNTRLNWKKVWEWKQPCEHVLEIWRLAKQLDTYRMRR